MKTIAECMTRSPHTIGQEQTLDHAAEQMRQHGVRHLPVLHGGRLVGILSDRDLQVLRGIPSVEPSKTSVEDAMIPTVYTVDESTPLHDVAKHMIAHQLGSAVITKKGNVSGIFTTVDALKLLV